MFSFWRVAFSKVTTASSYAQSLCVVDLTLNSFIFCGFGQTGFLLPWPLQWWPSWLPPSFFYSLWLIHPCSYFSALTSVLYSSGKHSEPGGCSLCARCCFECWASIIPLTPKQPSSWWAPSSVLTVCGNDTWVFRQVLACLPRFQSSEDLGLQGQGS